MGNAIIYVALIFGPMRKSGMSNDTPHRVRLKALGLSQTQLADMLGIAPNTISRQFNGHWEMPAYMSAFLSALEAMTPEQRAALYARLTRQQP